MVEIDDAREPPKPIWSQEWNGSTLRVRDTPHRGAGHAIYPGFLRWQLTRAAIRAAVALAEAQVLQTKTDLGRILIRAPRDGTILQVNVREGEYVGTPPGQALMVLGAVNDNVHLRVDIDEHDIPRFVRGARAAASPRGHPEVSYPLKYERIEPFVVPKKSLTGDNIERVDTRVLQAVYALETRDRPVYVGQQMGVFIDAQASCRSTKYARP